MRTFLRLEFLYSQALYHNELPQSLEQSRRSREPAGDSRDHLREVTSGATSSRSSNATYRP